MPPKHNGKHKPANIIVERPRQTAQTFNDTSLRPFLRAYTRMNSRDAGGGDRQFDEELNFSRRIVEELNRFRNGPPELIHELVYSIANPNSDQWPMYPTLRSHGVNEQIAYQNRIIVSVLLITHATNDRDGDGGLTRGGLWLPPRHQAREAQQAAIHRGQAVRYPTWSRDEAEASTPARTANWTTSGKPPARPLQGGTLLSPSSQGFNSAVGNLPPFSPIWAPTPHSTHGQTPGRPVLGPPSAGLGGYHWSSHGPQQYPSNSSLHSEYGAPPPPAFQSPGNYVQDTLRAALERTHQAGRYGNASTPYEAATTNAHELTGHRFWQPSNPPTTQIRQQPAHIPPPPGLEGMDHISAFGTETTSPARPVQPPIGSNRPSHDSRRHGGSRSSRGDSARGTPSRPAPGSGSRRGNSRSRRDDQGW
ncbi:hypothetical protein PMIN04_009383 [Paraphaeosphaeria minitans]|uniref:Uncharacterized protein n=1 Tax=Paraphaeosphaeria minitans TaxID=565426 RepID=A0A9P6GH51_9PLEO|nr:hypothetical protein PMIN01_07011 [Paraphaeosphaeria minitans]